MRHRIWQKSNSELHICKFHRNEIRLLDTIEKYVQIKRYAECARKLWETLRRSSQNLAIWVSQRMLFYPTKTFCFFCIYFIAKVLCCFGIRAKEINGALEEFSGMQGSCGSCRANTVKRFSVYFSLASLFLGNLRREAKVFIHTRLLRVNTITWKSKKNQLCVMLLKLWLAKMSVYFYFISHIQIFFLLNFRYVPKVFCVKMGNPVILPS